MTRILIGKKSDPTALARALGNATDLPMNSDLLTAGILPVEGVQFVGIDPPTTTHVNLVAPEPVGGEAEGWLYFPTAEWAAYTEDLLAVRIP